MLAMQQASVAKIEVARSRRLEIALLGLLLVAFAGLGWRYALQTPLFSRPDEQYHYAYALHLRATGTLPTVDTTRVGPRIDAPTQMEAHQPPLYYALTVALAGLLPAGADALPAINPHHQFQVDGTTQTIWGPSYVADWREVPLYLSGRLLSLVCGVAALAFLFLTLRLFLPWQLALLGTACVGFTPQFLFTGTAFSNDPTSIATVQLGLWQLGMLLKERLSARRALALGLTIGLATAVKLSGLGLLAPLGVIALWQSYRTRSARPLAGAVLAGLVVLLVDGWWFWRNWLLYGDPTTVSLLPLLLGPRLTPYSPAELGGLLVYVFRSFWLDFGPAGLADAEGWLYPALALVALAALAGIALYLRRQPQARPYFLLLGGWFGLVLLSFLRMTGGTEINMGGGRLLFPAVAAVGATLAAGLWQLGGRRAILPALLVLALGAWAALAPAHYLGRLYPPVVIASALPAPPTVRAETTFGEGALRLVGYDLALETRVGENSRLLITCYWQALRGTDRDLAVFLQLLDAREAKLAQADAYPTQYTYPTSRWRPGYYVVDRLELPLPSAATDWRGELIAGLYHPLSGDRLEPRDARGQVVPRWAVTLAELRAEGGTVRGFAQGQQVPTR
ncbi:MAG: glycosyltransferase family 39 protein [Chloroflexota bacterium]